MTNVNHDDVVRKLQNNEKLNDDEQTFINNMLKKQNDAYERELRYRAITNLQIAYARAHYEASNEEIDAEIKRLRALRK